MSVHDLSALTEKPSTELAVGGAHDPLLVLALQNRVPVETIERLVALKERAEERHAAMAFHAAMVRFRATCPSIVKTSKAKITTRGGGSGFEYSYAELDEISETVRPHLEANGLSYTWDADLTHETGILWTICTLRHVDGHHVTTRFPVPTASASAMSEQQRYAAAFTFGRRQSLFGALGLATTDSAPSERPQDMEKITPEQVANLKALLDEIKADASRREKFLAYAEVEQLEDVTARHYAGLVRALEAARKVAP
jgi:hypothetical protein